MKSVMELVCLSRIRFIRSEPYKFVIQDVKPNEQIEAMTGKGTVRTKQDHELVRDKIVIV